MSGSNFVFAVRCGSCSDRGVMFAREKESLSVFAFRCGCTAGDADRRTAIPRYRDVNPKHYLPIGGCLLEELPAEMRYRNEGA